MDAHFVAAPAQPAQHRGQRALRAFFVRKTVAKFMIREQHAYIRGHLKRRVALRAGPLYQRVRIAPFQARRRGICFAAAHDE